MAKFESYKVGDSEFSYLSYPLIVAPFDYVYSDLSAANTLTIPVEPDKVILGVAHEVTTAFSGGTPALYIGDGSDTDYWADETDFSLGAVGNFYNSWGSDKAGSLGRKYNAVGKIVLTHATDLAAGGGRVYVMMLDVSSNWRLAGTP